MPLREVADINARYVCGGLLIVHRLITQRPLGSTQSKTFPDLERTISRIHAKNCKVKDFLKVLTVRVASSARSFRRLTDTILCRPSSHSAPASRN